MEPLLNNEAEVTICEIKTRVPTETNLDEHGGIIALPPSYPRNQQRLNSPYKP
jgi:hypothetical protein